jgi:hypothetical protein
MEFCPSCGKDMRLAEIDEPDTPAGIDKEYSPEKISVKDPQRHDSTTLTEGAKVTVLNPCYCSDTNPAGTCVNCANSPKPES